MPVPSEQLRNYVILPDFILLMRSPTPFYYVPVLHGTDGLKRNRNMHTRRSCPNDILSSISFVLIIQQREATEKYAEQS